MCGIIGILNFGEVDKELERRRRETSIFLATELLQQTQTRGKDATGVANLFSNGDWYGLKEGIEPCDFVSKWDETDETFGGFVKIWRRKKAAHKVFLGHCRKTSVGSTWNNVNNHPIRVGDVIGIHNGTLENHDTIFENLKCKRDGEVDSEAIIRLIHAYSKNGTEPFTLDMVTEMAIRLQGSFAVLAMSGNNPFQVISFRDQRPIEMALLRPTKQIILTSDNKFTHTALYRMNKSIMLYNNKDYFHIKEEDVDFKILPNDSIAIWDLTREVGETTPISDLYIGGDIPRTNRIWRSTKGYTTASNNTKSQWNRNNNEISHKPNFYTTTDEEVYEEDKKSTTGVGEKSDTNSEKSSNNEPNCCGMVWDENLNRFKPTTKDLEDADELGHVTVDIDDGAVELLIKEAVTEKEQEDKKETTTAITVHHSAIEHHNSTNLITGDIDSQDDVLTDPVKIVELGKESKSDLNSGSEDNNTSEHENFECVEVDVSELSVDGAALTAAEESAAKLHKFEDLDDVLSTVGIADEATFKQVSTHAFANKLQLLAYKLGFYDGWKAKPDTEVANIEHDVSKKRRFETNFRVLKTLSNIVLGIIGKVSLTPKVVDDEITSALRRGEQLNSVSLNTIFSKGDIERNECLRTVVNMVKDKEK